VRGFERLCLEAPVSRNGVRVRRASAEDLDVVARFAEEGGGVRAVRGRRPDTVRDRCSLLLADDRHQVLLAVDDAAGEVLGVAVVGADPLSGLLDPPSVYVSHLMVAIEHRKRGAGRALVSAAAAYAEEIGVESVVVGVSPNGRDANRFFARLGFAPLVIRRIAPVAALRRTLGAADPVAVGDVRAHVARRGSARARAGLSRALPRPRVRRTI
jgi:ribosomal protein S18 acetylase RimI-like enzyme